eukprot:4001797-Ditylum_brightwellii.AAC.1
MKLAQKQKQYNTEDQGTQQISLKDTSPYEQFLGGDGVIVLLPRSMSRRLSHMSSGSLSRQDSDVAVYPVCNDESEVLITSGRVVLPPVTHLGKSSGWQSAWLESIMQQWEMLKPVVMYLVRTRGIPVF